MAAPIFPAALPTTTIRAGGLWASSDFRLARLTHKTPFRGGHGQVAEYGDAFWAVEYTTVPLDRSEVLQLRAWVDDLQDGMQKFLASDPARPFPRDYPNGFAGLTKQAAGSPPFTGTLPVTSLAVANRIRCGEAPAGFQLRRGDYVGLSEGNHRGLYRIAGDEQETATGQLDCWVEPAVPSFFTTAAIANFASPPCLALVDAASFSGVPSIVHVTCSFAARQQVWTP